LDWKPDRWPGHELTDALEGEREYDVVGGVDKSEADYAMGLVEADFTGAHETRRLRFRVYEMSHRTPKVYAAVDGWKVQQTDPSLVYWAKTVRSFRLADLNGDGQEEILFEGEFTAAAYRRWIDMSIFEIVDGGFVRVAELGTLSTNDAVQTRYSRELDLAKTRAAGGKKIFFKSTVYGAVPEAADGRGSRDTASDKTLT
jgi:hypothetical protein